MRGMEKTRRKPGLGSWGESRAVSGGTREGTGVFLTAVCPGGERRGIRGNTPAQEGAGREFPEGGTALGCGRFRFAVFAAGGTQRICGTGTEDLFRMK